jgi:hypothetical protein
MIIAKAVEKPDLFLMIPFFKFNDILSFYLKKKHYGLMILLRDIVLYTIFLLIILFNLLVLFYNKNSNTCAYYRVEITTLKPIL